MGLRVLLVRDEALVSGGIKKTLTNLGCNVIGPVTSVVASLAVLDRERVNLALIDSTSSDMRLPIADALVEKRIPFAYISGRSLELVRCTRHANVPVLFKPFKSRTVFMGGVADVVESWGGVVSGLFNEPQPAFQRRRRLRHGRE